MVVRIGFASTEAGMTEASATLRPSTPTTARVGSTTVPIEPPPEK